MSRTERLFTLLQALRHHRFPVPGASLADELGISLRTLYRDIASLQAQGANIEGEPGLGYVLRPGFMLPPLMFTAEEIEALVLGSRWVAKRTDTHLGSAAKNALAKISSVLPQELRRTLDSSSLMVGTPSLAEADVVDLSTIRQAIRGEYKLRINYCDLQGNATQRTIWPLALGYFDHVRMLAGWCEVRQDFRHFRTDRISALFVTKERYPRRKQELLNEWRACDTYQRASKNNIGNDSLALINKTMTADRN
ncbi:YafY family protein [Aquitalea sp.]|jgi:predicted DNA-binding transcriptional regulator YafY|uniref:helix-turn-helix transcriptional regulator n=1 Tax=Aquitalea sp. TaxID=1872623 RepID=UPI00258AC7DD|nr:YafY family protein [Aquitalea sp.]